MPTKTAQTTDIYLAAAYLAHGATMVKVDRAEPKHMVFHFQWETSMATGTLPVPALLGAYQDPIERLQMDWVNGNLLFRYAESIRSLKSIVHSSQKF